MDTAYKKDPVYMWLKKELKKTYRYYYDNMDDKHKAYYKKIFKAMLSFETTVKLPLMDVSTCEKIYKQCICDNPLFFYVDNTQIEIYTISGIIGPLGIEIDIKYSMKEKEVADALMVIRSKLESVNIACRFFNDLEKEGYIHHYLIEKVQYEINDSLSIHSAHSVFVNNIAVCDGISKAAKILMDSVGIRSMVISGNSFHPNTPGIGEGHAWNIVWIDNKPYHVDFTFDNNLSDKGTLIRYDYFNLSEEQIKKDHNYDDVGVHACFTNDWFRIKGLYFEKKSAVKMYVESGIRRKAKTLGFRIPFTSNPNKTINEMKMLITTVINENVVGEISYTLLINEEQMVIYILF